MCFSAIVTAASGVLSQRKVYVDSTNGYDNGSCLTSEDYGYPCKTLDYAFRHQANFITYVLLSEHYNITEEVTFSDLSGLKFSGKGAEVICHGETVGLAFLNVSDVLLEGITFNYCAATRNCTSMQFSPDSKPWCTFKVGLYFYLCENIKLFGVSVADGPNAIGVVVYDSGGVNSIVNSSFVNNSVSSPHEGGGGFYMEFTYCSPGSINCNDSDNNNKHSVNGSSYTFENVTFENNKANNEGLGSNSSYITPYRSNHQSLGRGGGLCIYIKGQARSNSIAIKNSVFKSNIAQWGAGIMVEYHDETANNHVSIDGCIFEENSCILAYENGTGGGGVRIGHYVFDQNKANSSFFYGNSVLFSNSNLTKNHAMYGGGLSISPALELYDKKTFINVTNVVFDSNVAKFGSAVYVSRYPFSSYGVMLSICLKDVKFFNNSINYMELVGKAHNPHLEGIGAIYINQVDVEFNGSVLFKENFGTGIAVAGSMLDFTGSNITFEGNIGYRGGAICLLGSAQILINDNTAMTFRSNVAKVLGGAMYIRYVEMDNSKTFFNCFIKHSNPFLNPNQWQSSVVFINNMDHNGLRHNSIHSTSIYPCGLAGGTSFSLNKKYIFCWTNWKYLSANNSDVDCAKEIRTEVGNIEAKHGHQAFKVIPGHKFQLPLQVMDDYENDLSNFTVFSSGLNDNKVNTANYFFGGSASVVGNSSGMETVVLSLESVGDVIWHAEVLLSLQRCPPGFQGDECTCSGRYGGALTCDPHSSNVTIRVQYWIGFVNGSYLIGFVNGSYLIGLCPPGFCKQTVHSSIVLPNTSCTADIEDAVCDDHRTDVLCGKCSDGYSPAVNSNFNCVLCNNSNIYINIVKYISSVYVPLIIFSVVLILFDIRLTTGPVNAFILFSQMVTTTFTLDAYGQIPFDQIVGKKYEVLKKLLDIPYGIFNLEFAENLLHPFCIRSNYTALDILALEYGVASFPLLMIVVATLCLKLKECCCSMCSRLSLKIVRNVHCYKKSNISQALLPAFASFILLSYHKFSLTSVYLMSSQSLIDENGNFVDTRVYFAGHLNMSNPHYVRTYFIPSVLVSILLFAFPILLLGYPLMLLEKCLFKIKPLWKFYPAAKIHFFLDTFHGCYKIKYQFFSGLYFLFRSCMNITYLSAEYWIIQFVVQQLACVVMVTLVATIQPYKQKYLNYVDALIFANLAFLNTLSLYMYFTYQNGRIISFPVFVIQYTLTAMPLLYVVGFLICFIWKEKISHSHKLQELRNLARIRRNSCAGQSTSNAQWLSPSADEELFARANSAPHNRIKWGTDRSGGTDRSDADLEQKNSGGSSSSNLLSSEGTAGYGTMSSGNSKTSI